MIYWVWLLLPVLASGFVAVGAYALGFDRGLRDGLRESVKRSWKDEEKRRR